MPLQHLYNSSTEAESCSVPQGLLPRAFLRGIDMGQQQCLHWKSSVLVIAVSMNYSMIGTGLWSAQPLTLPWTSDPIAKLHYLFSKAYFIAELLRCHVMEEEKEATGAGKEQMYPMWDHAPSFTQFVLIHHGDFTADAFQRWNSS